MKTIVLISLLALTACTSQTQEQFSKVCAEIQTIQTNPNVAPVLNAQDPHSAVGVLWADAKSACNNGIPVVGVSTDWSALVWGEIKALAPIVLPILIELI